MKNRSNPSTRNAKTQLKEPRFRDEWNRGSVRTTNSYSEPERLLNYKEAAN